MTKKLQEKKPSPQRNYNNTEALCCATRAKLSSIHPLPEQQMVAKKKKRIEELGSAEYSETFGIDEEFLAKQRR